MARTAKPKAKAPASRKKAAAKTPKPAAAPKPDIGNAGWATDLVFDVK